MPYRHIQTSSDKEFVTTSVALIKERIDAAIADHGSCIVGFSGGSTPKPIYAALGKEDCNWENVSIFLVDERYVPRGSSESNQKMLHDTLLKYARIPARNIVFPDTSLPIGECIAKYALELKEMWRERLPDVVLLGLGQDGHIASLFPPLEDTALTDAWLIGHTFAPAPLPAHDRITVSLNTIAAAGKHIFFLKGTGKKKVWEEMLASAEDERRWPAKRVLEVGETTLVTLW